MQGDSLLQEFAGISDKDAVEGVTNVELRNDNLFVWTATLKPVRPPRALPCTPTLTL